MRSLLKLSGQLLAGEQPPIDRSYLDRLAAVMKGLQLDGHQLVVAVGGGNLFRFTTHADAAMDPTLAHARGLMATLWNGLWLLDAFRQAGASAELMTAAFSDERYVPVTSLDTARDLLDNGSVVILAGGTGVPGPSTDQAAAEHAAALGCELVLKATHTVDGVYDRDPLTHPDAKKFSAITYDQVLAEHLGFMDEQAIRIARDHRLEIVVFSGKDPRAIAKVVEGNNLGTRIRSEA